MRYARSLLFLLVLWIPSLTSGQVGGEEIDDVHETTTSNVSQTLSADVNNNSTVHVDEMTSSSFKVISTTVNSQTTTSVEPSPSTTTKSFRRRWTKKTTASGTQDDEDDEDGGDEEDDEKYCKSPNAVYTEKQFATELLKNYQPNVRPRRDAREQVAVKFSISFTGIQEFNEKDSTLKLEATVKLYWSDHYLVYNETDPFHCSDHFLIPATSIWLPDLAFLNSYDGGKSVLDPSNKRAWVYSDGNVFLQTSGVLAVKCRLDIRMYPYDKQVCQLRVESVNYFEDQMSLEFYSKETDEYEKDDDPFDTDGMSDKGHPLWEMAAGDYYTRVEDYSGEVSPALVMNLFIIRKRLYYNVNIVTPSVILTATVFVNFVLPIGDGTKFGVGFAVLLAYTIFQMMVLGDIPRSSNDVPIFSIYILLQRIYIAVIIIYGQGIVFTFLSWAKACENKSGTAPSKRLYRSFEIIGKILLVRPIIKYSTSVTNKQQEELKVKTKKETEQIAATSVELCDADKWTYIAMVTDRITFVLYLLVAIITPIVITQLPDDMYKKEKWGEDD